MAVLLVLILSSVSSVTFLQTFAYLILFRVPPILQIILQPFKRSYRAERRQMLVLNPSFIVFHFEN